MAAARSVRLPLRRWARKVARAYTLLCAREDARMLQLAIPSGVWVCAQCTHATFFDFARFRAHVTYKHA